MEFSLNRVVIYVSDPIKCATFYRNHFGLKAIGEWQATWAELNGGSCNLLFHQAYDENGPVKSPTGSFENPHKIVFKVSDVGFTREKLINAGVKLGEVKDFDGWMMCTGTDLEGHSFQISNQ